MEWLVIIGLIILYQLLFSDSGDESPGKSNEDSKAKKIKQQLGNHNEATAIIELAEQKTKKRQKRSSRKASMSDERHQSEVERYRRGMVNREDSTPQFDEPIRLDLYKSNNSELIVKGPLWHGALPAAIGQSLKGRTIIGKCPRCDNGVKHKLLPFGINYYDEIICPNCHNKLYVLFQKEGWKSKSVYFIMYVQQLPNEMLTILQPISDYEDPRDYILSRINKGEMQPGEYDYIMYEQIQRELAISKNRLRLHKRGFLNV